MDECVFPAWMSVYHVHTCLMANGGWKEASEPWNQLEMVESCHVVLGISPRFVLCKNEGSKLLSRFSSMPQPQDISKIYIYIKIKVECGQVLLQIPMLWWGQMGR